MAMKPNQCIRLKFFLHNTKVTYFINWFISALQFLLSCSFTSWS